ncbi:glyoxalase family protein [Ahrensia sp. R2A130]|nr:glyoxalase family protein [Ahrensia sp. R2A130]
MQMSIIMTTATLEHVNYTVSNAAETAQTLCKLFGWAVRWEGEAMNGVGYTIHVGNESSYLALYEPKDQSGRNIDSSHITAGGLNHVAVVVDDIDAMEAQVKAAGYHPQNHGDYEPGRRFYFDGDDGVEFEIVSYT